MRSKLTLKEREFLCSQKGATWKLPFRHEVADRWRIARFKDELTQDEIKQLIQNKEDE